MKRLTVLFYFFSICFVNAQKLAPGKCTVQVVYSPGKSANTFIPSETVGAAFDGHGEGDIDRILSSENIRAMRDIGFGPVSYRLRTELGMEAWHWNPHGTWSEPEKQQGYWISDNHYSGDIKICNGYNLPRRGNTHDQANNDSYSMIDDGDTATYWKSNPYLDAHFTNESNTLHPQWVVVDLGKLFPVNAIRINWGNPFALSYKVDYALDIGKDYFDPMQPDLWHDFSKGTITNPEGENKIVIVSDSIIKVRFVRITMTESSETSVTKTSDVRDKLGFAIKEIEVGLFDAKEKFHDHVIHAADNEKQSVMHTSSTDPWHRAIDIDPDTEQAGIDQFFKCGLIKTEPVLMPVALLYDTPDNMIALLQYIKERKYDVQEFEMGEEPEGQLIDPQDYAALYCEWADAVKKIDTTFRMGGPGFASLAHTPEDEYSFTEQKWTKIFLSYLKDHHHLDEFNFFTFEWYPFDNVCLPTAAQLASNPKMITNALKDLQKTILPPSTPIYITEYGYSSHSGKAEVDIEGALMYADILGKSLTLGVRRAFLYGYDPTSLDEYNDCSWGNNMLFAMNDRGKIIYHTAAYYGINMLTHFWTAPKDSILEVYPANSNIVNKQGENLVTSYAIRTPQNKWSVVLVNKDPKRKCNINVNILNTSTRTSSGLNFPLHFIQYSRLQYHWKANGPRGHPTLELPPSDKMISGKDPITLPPYSLTIIQEN
ncbi:MAG: discoidin domain-containing protein [Chitinophagales bacterium]